MRISQRMSREKVSLSQGIPPPQSCPHPTAWRGTLFAPPASSGTASSLVSAPLFRDQTPDLWPWTSLVQSRRVTLGWCRHRPECPPPAKLTAQSHQVEEKGRRRGAPTWREMRDGHRPLLGLRLLVDSRLLRGLKLLHRFL